MWEVRDFLKRRKRINEQIVAMANIAYADNKTLFGWRNCASSLGCHSTSFL